eukprot:1324222-Amorphochlora_amoeboformis.AAC.1
MTEGGKAFFGAPTARDDNLSGKISFGDRYRDGYLDGEKKKSVSTDIARPVVPRPQGVIRGSEVKVAGKCFASEIPGWGLGRMRERENAT